MKVSQELVEAFASRFKGRTNAWGSVEGKSEKEEVTLEHYRNHLEGKVSLGIYPLLDDGTVWWAAIDLDEKDFEKSLAIRQAFHNRGLHAYVALSKGKGFHIYTFAEGKPFKAKEIRLICLDLIRELKFPGIEIFPKQDHLDQVIPLGNYINLPCFGNTNRQFMSEEKIKVGAKEALEKIEGGSPEDIASIAGAIKPPTPVKRREAPVQGRRTKPKSPPPCILSLLKGVSAGLRDNAAFALARFYLDQTLDESEVAAALLTWNQRNTPPLDPHTIEDKIKSAAKKYGFGCASIQSDPLLANCCVGEERCPWFKEITREKKKSGLILEASFYEAEDAYYEEVLEEKKPFFMRYDKETGEVSLVKRIDLPDDFSVVPLFGKEVTEGAIHLPTGIEEYNTEEELVQDIKDFLIKYVDIAQQGEYEILALYICTAWIADQLNTIGYIRFKGDTGSGKSRALDVIGQLCYKPIMCNAPTPAPLFRLIARWRGTLILDESDFKHSDETGDIVTVLNSGFQKGRPVIRCRKENPDELEILPCYGPKVFATRGTWADTALESRCTTIKMQETTKKMPIVTATKFEAAQARLRRKLLLWRFRKLGALHPEIGEDIDLGEVEPRVKQVAMPFLIAFEGNAIIWEKIQSYMKMKQEDNVSERNDSGEGMVVYALFILAQELGKEFVTSRSLSEYAIETLKQDPKHFGPRQVTKHLSRLGIAKDRSRKSGLRDYYIIWDDEIMKRTRRRYILNPEEFDGLFTIDVEV